LAAWTRDPRDQRNPGQGEASFIRKGTAANGPRPGGGGRSRATVTTAPRRGFKASRRVRQAPNSSSAETSPRAHSSACEMPSRRARAARSPIGPPGGPVAAVVRALDRAAIEVAAAAGALGATGGSTGARKAVAVVIAAVTHRNPRRHPGSQERSSGDPVLSQEAGTEVRSWRRCPLLGLGGLRGDGSSFRSEGDDLDPVGPWPAAARATFLCLPAPAASIARD